MSLYTVKVKHIKFLNGQDANKLKAFGIKVRVHNAIYDEHTSHVISEIELSEPDLTHLVESFETSIDNNHIIIDMKK